MTCPVHDSEAADERDPPSPRDTEGRGEQQIEGWGIQFTRYTTEVVGYRVLQYRSDVCVAAIKSKDSKRNVKANNKKREKEGERKKYEKERTLVGSKNASMPSYDFPVQSRKPRANTPEIRS